MKKFLDLLFINKPQMEFLTLSLSESRWTGAHTQLTLKNKISKMVRVSKAFTATILKEYSISFLMIWRLIYFALVVL